MFSIYVVIDDIINLAVQNLTDFDQYLSPYIFSFTHLCHGMSFAREHQIRDPASDDSDVIPVLTKQIDQFHEHPVCRRLLSFTIVETAS